MVRDYYARRGPDAWGDAGVPYVITNTTFLARSMAAVVAGFLEDIGGRPSPADPVYVVELGAGSGRFGYRFLNWLGEGAASGRSSTRDVCYVLTDFSESMLDHWSAHPYLAPLIAEGLVDVARFDFGEDSSIHLRHRRIVLEPARPQRAMVVLANYVFDSLPADVFAKSSRGLEECAVTLSGAAPGHDPAAGMEDVVLEWTRSPAPTPYYEDPAVEATLIDCAAHLEEGAFPFPVAAIGGSSRLYELADRVLLLVADKGYTDWAHLEGRDHPALARHQSVSLMVNFCALRAFNEGRGAVTMSSTRHSQRLVIEGFVAGGDAARYPATRSAFAAAVDQEHPNDAYLLWESCRTELGDWTAQQLLSLIRSCSWDSNVALSCLPHLIERAGDSPGLADELDEVADAVWELYFPIGESADLAMELGRLLLASGRAERALLFLSRSVELHGPTAAACYHLALAHRLLGDTAAARHHAVRALQLDPQQRDALALIAELS